MLHVSTCVFLVFVLDSGSSWNFSLPQPSEHNSGSDVQNKHATIQKYSLFCLSSFTTSAERDSLRHVLSHCRGLRDGDKKTIDLPCGDITVVEAEHARCKRGTGIVCSATTLHKVHVQVCEEGCRDLWCMASENATMFWKNNTLPHFYHHLMPRVRLLHHGKHRERSCTWDLSSL